jgi:hypothetical protein
MEQLVSRGVAFPDPRVRGRSEDARDSIIDSTEFAIVSQGELAEDVLQALCLHGLLPCAPNGWRFTCPGTAPRKFDEPPL